jgi:hypothetical protein
MINVKLLNALITVNLPDNDYQLWVIRTRKIAAKLEARSGYVISRNVATWFIKKEGSSAFFSRPQIAKFSPEQPSTPTTDSNGNIQITKVNNAMVNFFTTLINQSGNKRQIQLNRERNKSSKSFGKTGKTKARARWVPTSEASELIDNGRCFNCKKKGHIARKCPKYRPASRSAVQPELIILRQASPLAIIKNRKAAPAIKREKSNLRIKSHLKEKSRFPKKDCSSHK